MTSVSDMMRSLVTVLILLCAQLSYTYGQLAWGACPKVTVKTPFDIEKYLGVWCQKASYGTEPFQGKGKCVNATYTASKTNANQVDILNQQISTSSLSLTKISGTGTLANPDKKDGNLTVELTIPITSSGIKVKSPLYIIDTNYDSWAVVYSCKSVALFHYVSCWYLSRARVLPEPANTQQELEVAKVLRRVKLTRSDLTNTDQTNCG